MEENPRCKKCKRVLKSPISIARGMGPKCAGVSTTRGKREGKKTVVVDARFAGTLEHAPVDGAWSVDGVHESDRGTDITPVAQCGEQVLRVRAGVTVIVRIERKAHVDLFQVIDARHTLRAALRALNRGQKERGEN